MQPVIVGEYYLMGQTLKSVNYFNTEVDSVCTCVYEVVRFENSHLIFWQDHYSRLENSLKIAGQDYPLKFNQITSKIKLLIAANKLTEGLVKIDLYFHPKGEVLFKAYLTPLKVTTQDQQTNGIRCSLQFSQRHHPEAKIYNKDVRGKANTIIDQSQVYETILVNQENYLTEGSRSNVFFIKDHKLITADDSLVLPGIIRSKIITLARDNSYEIIFRAVSVEEIIEMEAVFITGTSPRLLPVKSIDKHNFNVNHPIMIQLKLDLAKLIEDQVNNKN